MRIRPLYGISAMALAAAAGLGTASADVAASSAAPKAAAACPWVGSTAPVEQRVSQVMAQITQSEEIALVHGVSGTYVGNIPANSRLCIPALSLQDGPAGVGDGLAGVTQLPQRGFSTSSTDPLG